MPKTPASATILEVQHPFITIEGLPDAVIGEMVVFPDEARGFVLSYQDEVVQVVSLSNKPPRRGDQVARLYQNLEFPVQSGLPGHVYTPLGHVMLDGHSTRVPTARPLDNAPPAISQRRRIKEMMLTGVPLVDQLLPLGKGQRELITGDRKTGKSSFAISTAITQAEQGVYIIYALIGKKLSDVSSVFQQFEVAGVSDKVIMIASTPTDSASMIYITPAAAITVAEYYRDQGCNTLVILDDLSTHAKFYRELSLLARQFPGRDSYPGDVFSVHARILERAGSFAAGTRVANTQPEPVDPEGAPCEPNESTVSITCLPIAETTDGDLTDYIVSNLISITDGHLLFDEKLFQQGQRPAVQTSLSVTRVGKQTLSPLGRDMNQKLTKFVTEYHRTQELSHFGTELRAESQTVLKRGKVLLDFFTSDLRFALTLQYLLVATIWLDWWESKPEQTIAPEIVSLTERYNSDAEKRTWLDQLVTQAQTFEELIDILQRNKDAIIRLCQP